MNWLLKLLFNTIAELLLGVIELFVSYIDNIFMEMYQLSRSVMLVDAKNYVIKISIELLIVFAIKQGIQVYVLHSEGDPEADALEFITRLAKATAAIICGDWAIDFLVEKSALFTDELLGYVKLPRQSVGVNAKNIISRILVSSTIQSFILLVIISIIVVSFILLIFKAAKRGAELIAMSFLMPFIAINLLTTGKEKWNSFISNLIICIFGYIVQLFCYSIFLLLFGHSYADGINMKYLIASLAWMIVVLNAPKWLQKYTYSSGVGNVAKGGLRSATYILPTVVKKM